MGSYLSAITLYATLMADDPLGLPNVLSGYRLSSSGEPSLDQELLIDLSNEKAQLIQEASWEVVQAMQTSSSYLDFEQPEPGYTIPVLSKGETIALKTIIGKWYGTGTYGSDYLGQVMEVKDQDGQPEVSLSFYSPHVQDEMRIDHAIIKGDRLILTLYDSLRTRNATLHMSLNNGKMEGILESAGTIQMYKHLYFSKAPVHHGINLSAVASLMKSFQSNRAKEGYKNAALTYYEQYGKLIGEAFRPEEFYLNAVGYNFLRDEKVNDALDVFELAMTYYPQSVNTYDSYAEALMVAERKDEALAVYQKAYELAKETGYENLAYIEENLNKLKNNSAMEVEGEAIPAPPPPSH